MSNRKRYMPLHSDVLVKMNLAFESEGGIVIPEAHRKSSLIGRVAEVGPEVRELAVGMVVLVPEYGHHIIHIDGVRHLMMHESAVTAIITED